MPLNPSWNSFSVRAARLPSSLLKKPVSPVSASYSTTAANRHQTQALHWPETVPGATIIYVALLSFDWRFVERKKADTRATWPRALVFALSLATFREAWGRENARRYTWLAARYGITGRRHAMAWCLGAPPAGDAGHGPSTPGRTWTRRQGRHRRPPAVARSGSGAGAHSPGSCIGPVRRAARPCSVCWGFGYRRGGTGITLHCIILLTLFPALQSPPRFSSLKKFSKHIE